MGMKVANIRVVSHSLPHETGHFYHLKIDRVITALTLFLFPATISHESHLGPNGRYFTWFHERMTWSEARAFCQSVGGDLAVLNTKILDQFVQDKFRDERHWIGATDIQEEGQWMWVNGQNMQQAKYRNWGWGEPNGMQEQNCLFMTWGRWGDGNCMKLFKPLCEHPAWSKCFMSN